MTKSVTFNAFGFEFGNAISCGLLMPYNCRRNGWKVHTCSRMVFPKEWTDSWFDDFSNTPKLDCDVTLGDKKQMEDFVFSKCGITDFKPLPVPKQTRKIEDKYIVFIPTIMEMAKGNPHKLELCMTFDAWMKVTEFVRSRGMKVVSFSCHESCSKEMSRDMSDIYFHAEKKDLRPNTFLQNQLEWMSNAETSVSFGGAYHVPFSFDVPGIGYDGQMIKNYINIDRSYLSGGRPYNCSRVFAANFVAGQIGMINYKVDQEMAKKFYILYADTVIKKIKETLVIT